MDTACAGSLRPLPLLRDEQHDEPRTTTRLLADDGVACSTDLVSVTLPSTSTANVSYFKESASPRVVSFLFFPPYDGCSVLYYSCEYSLNTVPVCHSLTLCRPSHPQFVCYSLLFALTEESYSHASPRRTEFIVELRCHRADGLRTLIRTRTSFTLKSMVCDACVLVFPSNWGLSLGL